MRLERISSHVDDLKRQVRKRWSKLTRKDVDDIDFDVGRLSEVVAERYAIPAKQAREEVDKFVSDAGTSFREASQLIGDVAKDLWRNGASHVMDAVHHGTEKAGEWWEASRDHVADWGHRTKRTVRENPWTTAAVAIGLGLAVGFLLRRRS